LSRACGFGDAPELKMQLWVTCAAKKQKGNVLSDRVLTDSGVDIGVVTDVVIDSAAGTVVGLEIQTVEEHKIRNGRKSYISFHDSLGVERNSRCSSSSY
jgi:sporulation protein YlmC with PRC-barrel domain